MGLLAWAGHVLGWLLAGSEGVGSDRRRTHRRNAIGSWQRGMQPRMLRPMSTSASNKRERKSQVLREKDGGRVMVGMAAEETILG